MLDKETYIEAIRREATTLAGAARHGLDAVVPSCPGWTVGVVVTHLTGIYAHRIEIVRSRAVENTVQSYEDLDLPAEYKEVFAAEFDTTRSEPQPVTPPGMVPLFERTASTLLDVLAAADPDEPVWTWWPADRTAGFWMRRMAHETAVHRWDVELAHGCEEPIESNLASDGIDEIFEVMAPFRRDSKAAPWRTSKARAGEGESYHFHRTDGPGEWLVKFEGDGMTVSREHVKAGIALRGPASDLLLFLWRRIPIDRLETFGDATLVERYFELLPPD